MNELRRHFRPEFLNRVDETVLFRPLRRDNGLAAAKNFEPLGPPGGVDSLFGGVGLPVSGRAGRASVPKTFAERLDGRLYLDHLQRADRVEHDKKAEQKRHHVPVGQNPFRNSRFRWFFACHESLLRAFLFHRSVRRRNVGQQFLPDHTWVFTGLNGHHAFQGDFHDL